MSINANCQRCRQPLISSSLPSFPAPSPSHPHHPHPRRLAHPAGGGQHVQDSVAALSPSTYDFLSASDRFTAPAPPTAGAAAAAAPPRPNAAARMPYPQMYNLVRNRTPAPNPVDRIVVPPPPQRRTLGPQDSYIVLTESVISPNSNAGPAMTAPSTISANSAGASTQPTQAGSSARRQATPDGPSTAQDGDDAVANSSSDNNNNSLQAHLAQLSNLYALLSLPPSTVASAGGTGLSHPLCTECTELLFELMTRELDALKKERDRLLGFEKDVHKRRDEVLKQLKVANPAAAGGKGPGAGAGELELKEALEKDIAKLRKAEAHAVAELKAVEAQKASLADDKAALDAEEAELAREEAEFWKQHSKYVVRRDELQDREDSLRTRLAYGHKELEKLQRTNVYKAGFGTINGLRLGRLPGINVEWPEINAAWGHTLLLLSTIAHKFGFYHFRGYRLVPCGSFSTIEKLEEDPANAETDAGAGALGRGGANGARGLTTQAAATSVGGSGAAVSGGGGGLGDGGSDGKSVVAVYELYGSGDFAVTRLLQNRRFDMAMVAFLECLRQLVEFVTARDPKVRVPHAVVKDRIGDVSIKLQFGSDEAWTRALRHVLLDLKILLSRASL
ncbi:autophagy protein 6 [Rhodotorula mucilaginosa]|uniref:Autophagy protein 6 n=1 Tax=Rhodotorula mucilaginosa TaxID=5537 RepID=A0A9P6W3U1_RHOMI|nr:autophagy protein 6 [Rhodotorula mucilaginosa]